MADTQATATATATATAFHTPPESGGPTPREHDDGGEFSPLLEVSEAKGFSIDDDLGNTAAGEGEGEGVDEGKGVNNGEIEWLGADDEKERDKFLVKLSTRRLPMPQTEVVP